ncbi:MAG: HyaD/HybD family hydrogenase maturation endopeptidase [Desulfobacterales bacterium]
MKTKRVTVLGLGNILLSDEGFGVKVVLKMMRNFRFPENVSLVDGNILGLNLLGIICETDHLIVVDAVKNNGEPGSLYRIDAEEIPGRIRAKNSLHQVDFLEALTLCQVMDYVPKTVIFGVEPQNIETVQDQLTPEIKAQMDPVIDMVLAELTGLGIAYHKGVNHHVPRYPFQDC